MNKNNLEILAEVSADSYVQGYSDAVNLVATARLKVDREKIKQELMNKFKEINTTKDTGDGVTNTEITES